MRVPFLILTLFLPPSARLHSWEKSALRKKVSKYFPLPIAVSTPIGMKVNFVSHDDCVYVLYTYRSRMHIIHNIRKTLSYIYELAQFPPLETLETVCNELIGQVIEICPSPHDSSQCSVFSDNIAIDLAADLLLRSFSHFEEGGFSFTAPQGAILYSLSLCMESSPRIALSIHELLDFSIDFSTHHGVVLCILAQIRRPSVRGELLSHYTSKSSNKRKLDTKEGDTCHDRRASYHFLCPYRRFTADSKLICGGVPPS